jgi:anti-sigma B factor antagonist
MQAWENDKNLHVLRLTGEIDLSTSRELRARLQTHVKAKSPALVLDFSDVRYIDSSGLATIVEYVQQARAFDGRIALAQVSDRVRTIFELVRLHEFIPIHPTVAEAATALGSGPSA